MNHPLVSVVIPTHNNADTIRIALRSILDQTLTDIEVIVVDDVSTDDTVARTRQEVGSDTRVRILHAPDDPNRYDKRLGRNTNAGWSARNTGLAAAKGTYITFQDGDDASLLNRLEIQLSLLKRHDATHITTECIPLDPALIGTHYEDLVPDVPTLDPEDLVRAAKQAKGIIPTLFPSINRRMPFHYKRLRIINKLFFGNLKPYPGAGNSPFFHKSVVGKVRCRPLTERVWPSFMGRGTDRDFNFQIAETFKNSYYFEVPLYLWNNGS